MNPGSLAPQHGHRDRCLRRLHLAGWPATRATTSLARFETAAVQQDNAVVIGQSKGEIERVNMRFEIVDGIVADVFTGPEFKVDQTVVCVVERVRGNINAKAFDHGFGTPVQDFHACRLIKFGVVHQLGQGEQAHHDLLGQCESGRMVQRYVAAVRDDAVYELDLARLKRQCAIAVVQCIQVAAGSVAIILSKMLSSWTAITPSLHPGAANVLRVGVNANGVLRQFSQ